MADYQAVPTGSSTPDSSRQPPVTATLVVYALFALAAVAGIIGHGMLVGAPLLTIIGIVAVIVAYVKRGDARGTWVESHLSLADPHVLVVAAVECASAGCSP